MLILHSFKDPEASVSKQQNRPKATYSLKKILLADALPVLFLFVIPFVANAGILSTLAGFMATSQAAATVVSEKSIDEVPLLRAMPSQNPTPAKGGGDIVVENGALLPDAGPLAADDAVKAKENNGEISSYIVREGDSLSAIASMFGVSVNTILWANDLKKVTGIKPGDTLVILPISGVRYTVKSGDTLKSIADAHKGDAADILAYNQLDTETDIQVGDTIVIPGGEVDAPKTPAPLKVTIKKGIKGSTAVSTYKDTGSTGYFTKPLRSYIKTQGIHGFNGVDLADPVGTPVYAAATGDVILAKYAGYNGGYGAYVVIKHPNGTQTLYAHLSEDDVTVGQHVDQGEHIGAVGNSGRSTGPHLHFEVRGAVNPF